MKNNSKYDAINKNFRKTQKTQLTGSTGSLPVQLPLSFPHFHFSLPVLHSAT